MGVCVVLSQEEKDLAFEEDLLRDPYTLKNWWYYLDFKAEAAPKVCARLVLLSERMYRD